MLPLLAMAIPALIGAAGSAVGGLVGQGAAAGDKARQRQILEDLLKQYNGLPKNPYSPQEMAGTAFDGVQTDPALIQQQQEMLGMMRDEARGNSLASRAEMELAQNEASRRSAAERTALENMLRNRGLGNSGAAVAMRVGGQREAANTQAQAALASTVEARRRAMQAMAQGGQMAGQMREQGFSEQARRAQARDMMAQYNANARQTAQHGNAQYGLQRMSGISNAAGKLSDNHGQQAQETQQMWANIGAGAGQVAGSIANNAFSQPSPAQSPYANPVNYVQAPTQDEKQAKYGWTSFGGYADGGVVPGVAPVPGDSKKNDVVPAKLSPGELVIPRSVAAQGPEAVREFARTLLQDNDSKGFGSSMIVRPDIRAKGPAAVREIEAALGAHEGAFGDGTLPVSADYLWGAAQIEKMKRLLGGK